jgi:hypothetical protein
MQERLRLELLRRIQRGTLSVSLLARQTGYRQSHLSNFLRCKRHLSLDSIDRILMSQRMDLADLLPANATPDWRIGDEILQIPVVSHASAMNDVNIRASAVQSRLWLPASLPASLRPHTSMARKAWQRFVAITATSADSQPMDPIIQSEALVLLDRHYSSLAPYRPNRPSVYAMRTNGRLKLRYVDFQLNRIVLRPHNRAFPIELLELAPRQSPDDLIVGRVALVVCEP